LLKGNKPEGLTAFGFIFNKERLEMEMKKVKLGSRICEVTTLENYVHNPDLYDPQYTALAVHDMVLPIVGRIDERIGICPSPNSMVSFYNPPSKDKAKEYSIDNVIDFNKAKNMAEIIQKQEYVKSLENEIIVNSDNIFEPRIDDDDAPEMKGLKEAVIAKKVDINAYAPRFRGNFANDKRLFNDNKITMSKLKKITNALDMKCTLIIEDKSDNVPNPIGKKIIVDITGGGDDEDDE
jgi:hypothetical protein